MAAKSMTKKAGAGRGRPPADGKKKKKSTAKMLMNNSSSTKKYKLPNQFVNI